jgi:hypothetical protein
MIVPSDPSLRFVLPEDAPYLKNMAALWAIDPKLAAAIELTDDRESYLCEPTRSGPPTACVPASGGRTLYLHSKYEPLQEAASLIDSIAPEEKFVFFLLGFGLGYHLELLAERASKEAIFCIAEPDLLMLRTAFEQRDFSSLIETGRVLFFTQPDKADLFVRLSLHNGLLSVGCEVISHPPSLQLAPEFFSQMETWIGELRDYSRTGLNTLILNGRRTAENITRNLGWYVASPGLSRLKERYKARPAIIVSAGPSLRKNKHLLKDAAGKAVIIAVQTTLQPLLEMGIEPQFVTSLDYHEICARFFEKLPPSIRTELIAEPKATDAIFKLNPGPLTLLGSDYAESLLHEMNLAKAKLPAGATVAHLAYYLAEHLGCDPIIFIGQDLGFGDGLCYTPGTSYEDVWRPEVSEFCTVEMKQWEQIVRDRQILRQIPDYQGRPMYTEERLFTYLQQFERDFGRTKTRIIDATEGGALKRGAMVKTLAAAIQEFCTQPLPKTFEAHPGLCWDRVGDCVRSLENRRHEAAQIEQIASRTLPLLEEIRDHLDDQRRVNKGIARIDVLRSQMDQFGRCYDLITELTQCTELRRFEQDRKLAASKIEGVDRQRCQVERDIDNVQSVIAASREFQALMDEVIGKLSAEHGMERAAAHKEAA